MSLHTRLTVLITALVVAATLMLSAVHLSAMIDVWTEHAEERAFATTQIVKREVLARAVSYMERSSEKPASFDEWARAWQQAIADDVELPVFLTTTLAQTKGIGAIAIAGYQNTIIACSDPARIGKPLITRPTMKQFKALGTLDRLIAIMRQNSDYETRAELGDISPERETRRVFTIQVVTPISLLRDYIMPEVRTLGKTSLLVLLLASLVAYASSQLAYGPLTQLGRAIDRIASGAESIQEDQSIPSSREYAVVQEKLRILGEQFRGAADVRGGAQQLLDRMETATLLFDRQGRLTMSSPAAERLMERSRSALANATIGELFPELSSASFDVRVRRAVIGKLRLELDPLPGGGALVRLSDPTGRELLESQLSVSSRLSAINRLTGRVAHEIKNPLNAISLQLEVLRTMFVRQVPEAMPKIEELLSEIARLDRVVRTFLDFTKPVELESAPFDLRNLVDGVLSLVGAEATAASIEVISESPSEPVVVQGDSDLVNQAVHNVVRNALEAMPEGGRLKVTVGADDEAVLIVSDTGIGIPPENREKIFQLYFSTKETGSGIGLAMTYRAIQLHGGTLEVESQPGEGTTMKIRLPLDTRKEVAV